MKKHILRSGLFSYLKAVIEEEKCDLFSTVTWLITQSNCFYSVHQTTMGGQQVGLQRE